MQPTAEQIARWEAERREYQSEVSAIRIAARDGQIHKASHPDNVRKRIAKLQAQLDEALNG